MQNKDKKYFIPVDGTLIEVSEEVYRAYYQPIWNTRYHAQKNGECRCNKAQLWRCDGVCPGCPFYTASKKLSIDTPIGGENDELTISVYSQDTREYAGSAGCTERQQLTETVTRESFPPSTDAYDLMLQNFSDAIHHGTPLIAPGEEGEKSMALINAAYLSAWKGTKVTLPFDPEEYRLRLTAAAEQEEIDG